MNNNRRKRFFANKMHKEIFILVAVSSIIPTTIITILLYYLIFNITAEELAIPEVIAYHILPAAHKVTGLLIIILPITIGALLLISRKISHKIIGPFDRIINDLDQILEDKKKTPVSIRKNDKFFPLVERINKILNKYK